jgi:hypothetical protein
MGEGQKLGTEALESVVELVMDGFDAGKEVLKDGHVDAADGLTVLQKLPEIGKDLIAVVGSANALIPEIKDLSSDELVKLAAIVMARGVTDSDKAKAIVGGCLKIAGGALDIVRATVISA